MLIYALYGLFVLLQIGDLTSTVIALRKGGAEANKLIAWLIWKIGAIPALGAVKVLIAGIAFVPVIFVPTPWVYALLALFDLLYVAVVVNNIKVVKTLSK